MDVQHNRGQEHARPGRGINPQLFCCNARYCLQAQIQQHSYSSLLRHKASKSGSCKHVLPGLAHPSIPGLGRRLPVPQPQHSLAALEDDIGRAIHLSLELPKLSGTPNLIVQLAAWEAALVHLSSSHVIRRMRERLEFGRACKS